MGAVQSRKSLWMTAASEAALDLQIEGTDLVVSVILDLPHPSPSCCHFPGSERVGVSGLQHMTLCRVLGLHFGVQLREAQRVGAAGIRIGDTV